MWQIKSIFLYLDQLMMGYFIIDFGLQTLYIQHRVVKWLEAMNQLQKYQGLTGKFDTLVNPYQITKLNNKTGKTWTSWYFFSDKENFFLIWLKNCTTHLCMLALQYVPTFKQQYRRHLVFIKKVFMINSALHVE